ncbi:MAG: NADPH-dependent assimilatory sulfite reductase hemoprotein subunit [Leptospiraceae bacterium]|nr:NADPH-dependent assimilatory sulfite reductase hemoprotein subunit [Leptospiraceae bacterium]
MSDKNLEEVEIIKAASNGLRGTLASDLLDQESDSFGEDNKSLLKFHGAYQQKDRDRKSPEEEELKTHTVMIRGRIPGGRLTATQWLVWDELALKYGNGSIRLTTRQSIQLHWVLKSNMKEIMKSIAKIKLSTMGACGDVVRNVTQAVNPFGVRELALLDPVAETLSDHFKFKSRGYAEIWLDEKPLGSEEPDPIYGKSYLPRKFKIAVTLAGNNSVDLYTNDLGIAATLNASGDIEGYFIFAGGGLGMSHNKPDTFPRKADLLGWIPVSDLIAVSEAVVGVHRDFGDRTNRKHARLKYVLEEKGVEWFIAEVEKKSGINFLKKELPPWNTPSYLGWNKGADGKYSLGFHTLSGRIVNLPGRPLKIILKRIISEFNLDVQLTAEQDLILLNIKAEDKPAIEKILEMNSVNAFSPNALYDRALGCVALPTCALALTEGERYLPRVLESLKPVLEKYGLMHKAPVVRMTGCPNGCARPYSAEIGIVGQQAGGKYSIFLGGTLEGTELAESVAQKVPLEEISLRLEKVFHAWKEEGTEKERLGEFVKRVSIEKIKSLIA